ncbi:TonB-dependent receptor [Crenothrix polyspora]|uniref:TonB-dependent receptor n=1 Tax=Crenothrix polyspora TaxID=360316 RepID=A0A1R4H571_9GAMM|nr:TonB-dependent receptor [Crenothrix polyspora]SJM91359.1 TonB-dependent receptor [Crenothrix polyspora]
MKKHLLATFLLSNSVLMTLVNADDNTPQELEEVTVTSDSLKQATSQFAKPVTILSGESLRTQVGQTLGDTLQNEPGITSQSFGAGVGTPVIRGQSGSRVKVMQNSLGNNDVSSLSPDHATGVDPIIAERVEVLRGPSTLLYGSGAIGGIVNVIDNRIPEQVPGKLIGGAAEQRYDSATSETSSALKLEGGKSGYAYHVDGFYRDQNNTHIGGRAIDEAAARLADPGFFNTAIVDNPDGVINGSQARSRGGSIGFSKVGDLGLVGAAINSLEKKYGIPPDGKNNDRVTVDMRQTKIDFKAQLNKPFSFAEQLRMKFGYTDYQHVELVNDAPETTFLNTAYENRLELEHKPIGIVKGTVGFQSTNSQFSALGDEALVPPSDIDTYSLFAVESFDIGAVSYDFGLRGEWQTIRPQGQDSLTFLPLSGSASALWQINDQHQLTLAYTHSERAPQIQELLSKGRHEATHSYEIGNRSLSKELSNNLDLSYRFNGSWMTADISLFHNWVGDYIYQQRSGAVKEGLPVLNAQQGAATFKGFEAQAIFPLMENSYGALDLTLFSDYTRGTFDNGGDVPRLPPLRYGFQLSYEKADFSGNLRFTRAEAQNNPGQHDTNTSGYLLLNLQTQYRLASFHDSEVLLFAKGKNLLDENIRNSTSYLRNFAPEPSRSAELGIRINY